MLVTSRMTIVPATVPLARAELTDRMAFARLLQAKIPPNWPPEMLADALPLFLQWLESTPHAVGWFSWYGIVQTPGGGVLAASGGFKGPPQFGVVEIGYSVLPQFQGQGYATEMVHALLDWVLQQPGLTLVIAEAARSNTRSQRVLHKVGFLPAGEANEPDHLLFELQALQKRTSRGV